MSSYKLSFNQEFKYINGRRDFVSGLFSFSENVEVNKLKFSCELVLALTESFHYIQEDVLAFFPILKFHKFLPEIKVLNEPNYSKEKFNEFIMDCVKQENLFNNSPVKFFIVSSDKTYLGVFISSFYSDNKSLGLLVDRILSNYLLGKKDFNEEVNFLNFSQWQREILDEEVKEENYYWAEESKITDFSNPKIFKVNDKLFKIKPIIRDVLSINKTSCDIYDIISIIYKSISQYADSDNFNLGYIPFERNHDILKETFGLLNVPLPLRTNFRISSIEKLKKLSRRILELESNRDNFNYSILNQDYLKISIERYVANALKDNPLGVKQEVYYPFEYNSQLKIILFESDDIIKVQIVCNTDTPSLQFIESQIKQSLINFIEYNSFTQSASSQEIKFYLGNNWISKDVGIEFLGINKLLRDIFKRYPEYPCLTYLENTLTFQQVDSVSNIFANFLSEKYGIKQADNIGLLLSRGLDQIITLISVIKTGACFVPLEKDWPEYRIDLLKKEANLTLIVNDQIIEEFYKTKHFYFDEYDLALVLDESPLYCIFTSGTTGKPKGCKISNKNFYNYISWSNEYFKETANKRVGYFSPLSFDFTLTSIFGSFISGSNLLISEQDSSVLSELNQLIADDEVYVLKITPAHVFLLDVNLLKKATPKTFILGGEALTEKQIEHLRNNQGCRIYNEYGPTEATIGSIVHLIEDDNLPVIGKPIPGLTALIVSQNNDILPVGCKGEIVLSGDGVIKNYINDDSGEVSQKFIKLKQINNVSFYKTGDLGLCRFDGNLEYLGRIDDQVKIRGYRIEPAEIEQVLSSHPQSGGVVVLARAINNTSDKELIVYTSGEATTEDLKQYLRDRFPSYMVPNYYVHLESIPLSSNGKMNRKALPDPEGIELNQREYVAPIMDTEKKLVKIWSEVLGVAEDTISIKADFFELGGHSINAIQTLFNIFKVFPIKISLNKFFEFSTIEQLSKLINATTEKETYTLIPSVKEAADYALSSSQRRLWVLSKFDGANEAYNIPQVVRLEGSLNGQAFTKAYQSLLTRHEVLRTIFTEDAVGNPRQRVLPITDERCKIRIEDYGYYTQEEKDSKIKEYVSQEISRGFSLEQGPLIRCTLLKETDSSYLWILVMHHIVSDGWSMGVLHREWSELYNAELEQRSPNLSPLSIQYKDYAAWHNGQLQSEEINPHKEYWLEQFKGELPVLELPSDKPRPKVMTYNGASVYRELDKQTTEHLKAFSQSQGGTLFMTLQTALNILLYKYTGQEDIVIGSPIAGREHPDLEGQIGFYLGALPIRTTFSKEDTVSELYKKVKQNTLGAYSHQVYPYDELVDTLNLARDISRNPLFDVWLDYHSLELESEGVSFNQIEQKDYYLLTEDHQTKFNLTILVQEKHDGSLGLIWEFNRDIYVELQVKNMLNHFINLLATIVAHKDKKITNYEILSEKDKGYLLEILNNTKADYQKDCTIIDLFEYQVENTPDNIAITYKETKLSYRELNEKANQLAHYLIKNFNIQPDELVGIELERSEWMLIGILGIIKSGGAYVPIEPEYPTKRKEYIYKQTSTKTILNLEFIEEYLLSRVLYPCTNPKTELTSTNLMYSIFTSGSSGLPKGVMIEHSQIINTLIWRLKEYNYTDANITLQIPSFAFDSSVEDIFTSLLSGGKLIIVDKKDLFELEYVCNLINKERVTNILVTPNYYTTILSSIKLDTQLKHVTIAGENFTSELVASHFNRLPNVKLYNEYGPTENSVCSTFHQFTIENQGVTIGKPIQNINIILLDNHLKIVPFGVIGEICISGAGLARGYLDDIELNSKKFIDNPYKLGERLYRTGDLGRWRLDENLEYLGRIDDQVKIRGYRIELGEIEQCLKSHSKVTNGLVLAKSLGNNIEKDLISYYSGEANQKELEDFFNERLPNHLIPNYFIRLDSIPITTNGKADKNKLPLPEFDYEGDVDFRLGKYIEKILKNIWSELLNIDKNKILKDVDFFKVGGNSLKLITLTSRINNYFGKSFKYRDVLENSTINKLKKLLFRSNVADGKLFYRLNSQANNEPLILLFPPGGGEGLIYKQLAIQLDNKIELWTFDYTEDVYDDCQNYINYIFESILSEFEERKIIIGGYSLGFRLAYYVCLKYEQRFTLFINLEGNIFRDFEDQKRVEDLIGKSINIGSEENAEQKNENKYSKNEELYFVKELPIQVIHIIGSESYSKFNVPTYISKNHKIIFVKGGHEDIMEIENNNFEIGAILSNLISMKPE